MDVVDSSQPSVTVNGGKFDVTIQNGLPRVYYPASNTNSTPHKIL